MDSSTGAASDSGSMPPLSDPVKSVASSPSKDKDKILRRGDLARILGRKDKKLRDHHQGDLGRVTRSIPVGECDKIFDDKDDYDPHPFVYDIELILGGKLTAVRRSELQYTTAFEEGMTGESRQKRQRKHKEEPSDNLAAPANAKKKPKKFSTVKSTGNQASNKKRGASVSANKGGKTKKPKASLSAPEPLILPSANSNGLDIFERHRREFERSLVRLEKADTYGYFTGDDIPPEYDECYNNTAFSSSQFDKYTAATVTTQQSQNPSNVPMISAPILPPPALATQTSTGTDTSSIVTHDSTPEKSMHNPPPINVVTPSTIDGPPFNFVVLRKRLEHGRYILDRERFETEERIKLLTPYYKSIGKRIPSSKKKLPNFLVYHKKGIDWDLFRKDVLGMCDAAVQRRPDFAGDGGAGTIAGGAKKIKELMEQIYDKIAKKHYLEMEITNDTHRYTTAINASPNMEAAMQGKRWRREAFPERRYEKLKNDVVCAGLSELDERIAAYELKTSLKDSFVGLAYTYDDNGQSEGWMKAMLNEAGDSNEQQKAAMALSSDEGVIKAQVAASMETLLMAVQDRVMTENGVLEQPELRSANWECKRENISEEALAAKSEGAAVAEIVEQPVWGMDCYTRRNVAICLETEFDKDTVHSFIEKWLLPAINACPVDLAYNLSNAALILEGVPFDTSSSLNQDSATTTEQWSSTLLGRALIKKIQESSPPWLKAAAHVLRRAITSMGQDFFRVHPKGHGSIVLCPKIEPNRLVTFYRGEVYPSWRWGEKMDAISVIQEKKGLKPRLPDFYNMALERPQMDPRGYGLLFVDASRKSGYGSMLSHSCNPSCEVKVVALNGELTLAMTTLREMTIGEEVTFDYNAATDSLHEYQAAVCLCGNVQCRGSFLHFAMADCYQQVLNRNSPIAVLLSQLIKGCTKQVMAEDDDKILKRHGFQSAVFGAVSVNRRKVNSAEATNGPFDSMDFVPIWLRTFVADTLRYIEYERRALPIALLCNEITKDSEKEKKEAEERESSKKTNTLKKPISSKKPIQGAPRSGDEKPIKGHKPEPSFFFFSKQRREHFHSQLSLGGKAAQLSGLALESELKKLASAEWKTLSPEEKETWKSRAFDEWKKNGGVEKARLEAARLARLEKAKNSSETKAADVEVVVKPKVETPDSASDSDRITFQAADAEGIRAMEQRIQQLTQSLSRVGRVLDRHREVKLRQLEHSDPNATEDIYSPATLRALAHSPLSIMPDEHVVAWMWNNEKGVVRTLLRMARDETCVSPDMYVALQLTESKFSKLSDFGSPWINHDEELVLPMSPSEGRKMLNDALMEFRTKLLEGMDKMASNIKKKRASARDIAKRRSQEAKRIAKISTPCDQSKIRLAVNFVLSEIVHSIEEKMKTDEEKELTQAITEPWLLNYNKRFKIEKAADLLLLYAQTSTFFRLDPYEALKSSPIEVYARELGNEVPRSVVDQGQEIVTSGEVTFDKTGSGVDCMNEQGKADDSSEDPSPSIHEEESKVEKRAKDSGLCDPEDIISEVVVGYQGDYILSQLLQWYNAGLEQKPGLPEMLGCCTLPSMKGCWTIDTTKVTNSSTEKSTSYRWKTRPRLVEWLKDPYKRGSPWPDELRRQFVDNDDEASADGSSLSWMPIGSPVLDLLVTGDDCNMMTILELLGSDTSGNSESNEGLMSTVDHGRPAQAVSNWVQCENPSCQKWRKIPWHVDIDMLSEKFVCSDNIWNKNSASCDAPEDNWDEENDACVEADGSVKPREVERLKPDEVGDPIVSAVTKSCKLTDFQLKARFDVLRTGKKSKWSAATVVDLDFVGVTKRVKFHFPRSDVKHDIWLEAGSNRIAPLYTHTSPPQPRQSKQSSVTCGLPSLKAEQLKVAKTKKQKKKKAVNDDSSFDSSFAMAASENGSETFDNENEFEEIGVGAVEDYEEIGDADTDDSEDEEIELVDDEEHLVDTDEDDDDGLNDEIQDDSDDDEFDHQKIDERAKNLAIVTVTDHSSPDGSPKRDRDSSMAEVQQNIESTNLSDGGEKELKIPKKKKSLHQHDQHVGTSPSRIPKKKKFESAPQTILGALNQQNMAKNESPTSALCTNQPSGYTPNSGTAIPPGPTTIQQRSILYDRKRALELARDWEQWKRSGHSTSNTDEQSRKRAMNRNIELRLNRESLNERHAVTSGSRRDSVSSSGHFASDRHAQTRSDMNGKSLDYGSPRRISLSHQPPEQISSSYGERAFEMPRDSYDHAGRDADKFSLTGSSHADDYNGSQLGFGRLRGVVARPVDRLSYNQGYDDTAYERDPRDRHDSPRKYYDRSYDQGPNGYREEERYAREEMPRYHSHDEGYMDDADRYRQRDDHRPRHEGPTGSSHRPRSEQSCSLDYRPDDRPERPCPSRRGYEVEKPASPVKRGYDIEPLPSPQKRGYPVEANAASPARRGYPVEEKRGYPVEVKRGYPVEDKISPSKRKREEDLPKRGRDPYDDRADDRYRGSSPHRHDDGFYSRHDDGYRGKRDDARVRDDYNRREYDDGRRDYDGRRDHRRKESPRSSHKSDHLGRDEYAYRAQQHARRADRYYDDGYRR